MKSHGVLYSCAVWDLAIPPNKRKRVRSLFDYRFGDVVPSSKHVAGIGHTNVPTASSWGLPHGWSMDVTRITWVTSHQQEGAWGDVCSLSRYFVRVGGLNMYSGNDVHLGGGVGSEKGEYPVEFTIGGTYAEPYSVELIVPPFVFVYDLPALVSVANQLEPIVERIHAGPEGHLRDNALRHLPEIPTYLVEDCAYAWCFLEGDLESRIV